MKDTNLHTKLMEKSENEQEAKTLLRNRSILR